MSERLPYEEQLAQQWDDLPVPDVNMAWADMKRRLEEDEDRPLLPFWLRGCAGWGLLGILLLGLGWWIVRPDKWFFKKNIPEKTITIKNEVPQNQALSDSAFLFKDTGTLKETNSTAAIQQTGAIPAGSITRTPSAELHYITTNPANEKKDIATLQVNETGGNRRQKQKPVVRDITNKPAAGNNAEVTAMPYQNRDSKKTNKEEKEIKPSGVSVIGNTKEPVPADKVSTVNVNRLVSDTGASPKHTDTLNKIIASNHPTADTAQQAHKKTGGPAVEQQKKDSTKKHPLEWSAGIGLQQQLPVGGQKWSPYNAQGRKNSLADYIPSVYVRLTRPQKWFLQAEFRYGAPKNTRELEYRQQKVSDTGSAPRYYYQTTTTLKKTYYHELPVVFNYYIMPGWSVGAGIQWNNFYRALSELEVLFHNNSTSRDSVVSKTIQPERRDSSSVFKKSFFQAVIESQYKTGRFSFGARYSFGLQPFMEFTTPAGVLRKENLSTLQLFIRFELWRQKKKPVNKSVK